MYTSFPGRGQTPECGGKLPRGTPWRDGEQEGNSMAFETRIARRVSLAVERRQTSTWIRRGGRTRVRGVPAWTGMAVLGGIALTPIVASATAPPAVPLGGTAVPAVDP